jgi:integrase
MAHPPDHVSPVSLNPSCHPLPSLERPAPRTYTRTDFTALRARVQGVPPHTIVRLYYDPDSAPQAASSDALERYLRAMRDELVRLALIHGSPVLAEHLRGSMRKHGSAKLTALTLRMVEDAARLAVAVPLAAHSTGLWFRPLVAKRLAGEGIATLGALVEYCNRHGGRWWRSVPRIGALRARALVTWLRRHEATLGVTLEADVDTRELLPAPETAIVIGGPPGRPKLAPFERMAVPAELCGGEGVNGAPGGRRGTNRAHAFAFIRAPHDLAALHAWLHRYRDRPATLRAYTRELERFVLWAVIVRGVAVSSVTVEDCEAYKDFLAAPLATFAGPRRARASGRWKPFTGTLSVDSQAYAVRTLRAAFAWLVDVRYLAGNPWHAVQDPARITRESRMQVQRALPARLWSVLKGTLATLATGEGEHHPAAPQWRVARAAILLMGDSGLRRDEVAGARREALRPESLEPAAAGGDGTGQPPLWTLVVTGKGRKTRTVPVSPAALAALRAHWTDRQRNFDAPDATGPLLAPLITPNTRAALAKRERYPDDRPYHVNALGDLVQAALQRLVARLATQTDVSAAELTQLAHTSAHALRHTFGTQAIAREMPADVVQAILGHASLQTTSLYVRAERQRMLEAAARYYTEEGPTSSSLPSDPQAR